jgi:glycosyltransferase involved in cell wall biosynthesis
MNKNKRVVLFTDYPARQRIPLFNELSEACMKQGYSLHIIFQSAYQKQREWWKIPFADFRFSFKILDECSAFAAEDMQIYLPVKIVSELSKLRADVFIISGFSLSSLLISMAARLQGIPFVIWSGAVMTEQGTGSAVRKIIRSHLTRNAKAFVAYGNLSKQYLMSFGAGGETVKKATNTVDISFYMNETEKIRKKSSRPEAFEAGYLHFLCVSRFIGRKGVPCLLKALALLRPEAGKYKLHLVGDGPEKEDYIKLSERLGLKEKVHFWGFQQEKSLPDFYAGSQVFIFPTLYDPWGLVLNEAMAAGLLVIASLRAGATYDLVDHGKNGFVIDPENTRQFSEILEWCLTHREQLPEMGENGRKTILEKATIEKSAQGFTEAIALALK